MLAALLTNLDTGSTRPDVDLVPRDLYEGIRKRSREVRMERESLRDSLKSMLFGAIESQNPEISQIGLQIERELITPRVVRGKSASISSFVDYDRLLNQFQNIEKLLKVTPEIRDDEAIIALLMDEY